MDPSGPVESQPREPREPRARGERHPQRGPHDDRRHRDRDQRPTPPTASVTAVPDRHTPPSRGANQARVGILVDLAALRDQARAKGAELAIHRLRAALAGPRRVVRAISYTPIGSTPPSGFESRPTEDRAAAGVRMAIDAMTLLPEVDVLLLAPISTAVRQLAASVRAQGHGVELADFSPAPEDADLPVRQLGRDCLFVP